MYAFYLFYTFQPGLLICSCQLHILIVAQNLKFYLAQVTALTKNFINLH